MNTEIKRELKFRAWNGIEMKNVDQITFTEKTWTCENGYGVSIPFQPHIKLMQFTGLHDKNGVEIYEGDIFKHEQQSPFDNGKFKTEIGIVEWGIWSYMYGSSPNKPMFAFDRMKARQVEIIGNIYQNENLIK